MAIFAEFRKGSLPFNVHNVVKLPKYEDWAMVEQWPPMNAWRVLLDGWMGPFAWAPTAKSYIVPARAAK